MVNDITQILTAKILSEITWKILKEGCSVTKEILRQQLKKYALTESELNILENSMNKVSDCSTLEDLKIYIKNHDEINKVLTELKYRNPNVNKIYSQKNKNGPNVMNFGGE